MQSQRILLQPAYVLHQRPYRDTSRILDVLTRDFGRLTLFARGVRGSKGGLSAVLQSFQPLLLSWSGKGEAGQLTAAELVGEPQSLPAARLLSGFYLNELLLKLLHIHDPQPQVFATYTDTLQHLKAGFDELATLRIFEKHILQTLGFGLRLDCEAESGRPVAAQQCYRYVLELGALPVAAHVDPAKGVFSGAALLALAGEQLLDAEHKLAARHLLRAALDHVLEGRKLQSRSVLQDLRQLQAMPVLAVQQSEFK